LLKEFSPTDEHRAAGAVVLWKDKTVRIGDDGLAIWTSHIAVLVLDDQAASDYGEITVGYNSFYKSTTLDDARVVYPDGAVKTVSADAVQIRTHPNPTYFGDTRWLTFALPTLVASAAIEFRVSTTEIKPIIEGHWTHRFGFNYVQWGAFGENPRVDPVREARLVVHLHGDGVPVTATRNTQTAPRITRQDGHATYVWEASDLPSVPVERFSPPLRNRLPVVVLGSIKDWKEIDQWAAALMLPAVASTSALDELARTQTTSKTTRREKVEALFDFMQDEIRYIHADVHRGGLTPHPPEEVLDNHYGDCKDQAVLFVSLLRAAGVDAYPALIGTFGTGDLIREVPRPLAFNHAIVYAPGDDGALWIDSTPTSAPYGALDWSTQDRWALVINGKGGQLLKTPASRPEDSEGKITVDFEFVEGNLEATIAVTASGPLSSALKSALRDNPQRNEFMERLINNMYPMGRLKNTAYPGLDVARKPFRGESRVAFPDVWRCWDCSRTWRCSRIPVSARPPTPPG
jgi:transglutaminase-like putative cysteine protease